MSSVVGPYEESSEFRLRLPEGWHARLPADVDAESAFGRYTAHYSQTGRELTITRKIAGATGTEPPEHINALIDWLRDVSRDDVRYVVLDRE